MSRSAACQGPGVVTTRGRVVWVLTAAAHVPGLFASWRSLLTDGASIELVGECLWLTLAIVFFALKILGVSFLRFHADRRTWVGIGVGVALLHVDLLPPALAQTLGVDGGRLVGTAVVASVVAPVRRLLTAWRQRAGHEPQRRREVLRFAGLLADRDLTPACWLLRYHSFLLRAPPA